MAKYSFELKKLCVKAYQKGEGSYTDVAKKYGIKDKKQVINWVHSYEHFGTQGLLRSRNSNHYSFEEKLFMVRIIIFS